MKRQVITIQEDMVIYAPHHGEVWMTVWEIAELLNVTGTAVKLENGYSAHVYDMEVIIDIALQMDTYQALLFRRWLVEKIGNRKECQATSGKQGRTTIIVMNGTMPRGIS